VAGAVAALVTSLAVPAAAGAPRGPSAPLDYLGDTTIPAGMPFDGTVVGGLSSITYDASRDVYYALSDDQEPGSRRRAPRRGWLHAAHRRQRRLARRR
jgi:hypothetical protein